jgi:hypothetical protein
MAKLFDKDQFVIARLIKNVFNKKEHPQESNMHILHKTPGRMHTPGSTPHKVLADPNTPIEKRGGKNYATLYRFTIFCW